VKEAFRAAHTLKGVCQNLGFTNLYQPTCDLTEVLRTGTLEGTKAGTAGRYTCQSKSPSMRSVRSSKLRIWLDLQTASFLIKRQDAVFYCILRSFMI